MSKKPGLTKDQMYVNSEENSSRRRWNIALVSGAVIISVFFLVFTNYLVGQLSRDEKAKVQALAHAFEAINASMENYERQRQIIANDSTTKIIIVDENERISLVKNYDTKYLTDTLYLKDELAYMKFFSNPVKIPLGKGFWWMVYYKEKTAITMLRIFPYVQLILIAMYIGIGYIAFASTRRSMQNRVWVGMAKATAHQIGTPLSSLMAWIEYLGSIEAPPTAEVLTEMTKDIDRLNVITERFSKIGSRPELEPYNIYEILEESADYLRKRISRKVKLTLSEESDTDVIAEVNRNLFSWVIENLTKNAVDAMSGEGKIEYRVNLLAPDHIIVEVSDSGKGISRAKFRTVFEPGYTTRKRGWGLGLSLAKRIIEEYHKGEIYVKDSEVGKGTTFRIQLNRSKDAALGGIRTISSDTMYHD